MTMSPLALTSLVGKGEATIQEAFETRVRLDPDRTFLIWGGRQTSYHDAATLIRSAAGNLRAYLGSDPEPRVASFLSNRPEALWAWLGSAYAGAIYVPLNRNHKGALLADLVNRARASVIITDDEGERTIRSALSAAATPLLINVDQKPWPSKDAMLVSPANAKPSDVASILFTSGTTGRAKAVRIPHNQYCRGAAWVVEGFGLHRDDVFHNWLPLFHLGGQLHMTMTAVMCGGAVALFPTFSRSQFRQEVREANCSVVCGFSTILNMIWSLPEEPNDADLPLRVGIFAGIPDEVRTPFEKRFGMRLGDNYGMTELDPVTLPGSEAPLGSSGAPIGDFEVAIHDDEGRALEAGELGEICVRPRAANVMMHGYEDDDAATVAAFKGLWFHTGDFGIIDARGYLQFKGRKSGYIRRRGENISVAEVESIILQHPAVRECAVIGAPSELGEDEVKLIVVAEAGRKIDPAELHAFATEQMAAFMAPRFIAIVPSLPRTELGKVATAEIKNLSAPVWDAQGVARERG